MTDKEFVQHLKYLIKRDCIKWSKNADVTGNNFNYIIKTGENKNISITVKLN